MENKNVPWQVKFGLSLCSATSIDSTIPAEARGVAVIYAATPALEKIFLVVESRSRTLRSLCTQRLQTAKLPAPSELTIAFQGAALTDDSPATIRLACQQQIVLAAELRRELRPAMR